MTESRLDCDIKQIISENGLADVVAALARYCHAPPVQHYPPRKMATAFRRLDAIVVYLLGI